jgi:HlyD family secretion protein
VRAEADVERLRVAVSDAGAKLTRARQLAERQLIPASELETAEVTLRSAQAQQRSAEAQVTQARATLSQAEVNLEKTIITSPIDGIVIARNVDVGQTVAASLQAPTLFEIAADMRRMQIKASVDEADVGQVRQGQPVGFTVDAYPGRQFSGTVQQVRLNPVVEQNVVTYAAIISADNPDLMLRPGMTANVTVEIARRDDVLRVPAASLRFRPSADVLSRLGAGTAVASSGASVPAVGGTAGAGGPAGTQGEAVWVFDSALRRVPVKTGVSDGVLTELVEAPDLAAGTIVVTRAAIAGDAPRSPGTTAGNPLLGSTPPRR